MILEYKSLHLAHYTSAHILAFIRNSTSPPNVLFGVLQKAAPHWAAVGETFWFPLYVTAVDFTLNGANIPKNNKVGMFYGTLLITGPLGTSAALGPKH